LKNFPLEFLNINRNEASLKIKGKRSFKKITVDDSFLNKEDISIINLDKKSKQKRKDNTINKQSASESEGKSDEEYSKSYSEENESDNYSALALANDKKGNILDDEENEENELEEENESDEQVESEDTDEELMREYEKIKKMREEEKKMIDEKNAEKLKKQAEEQLLLGNPLVNVSGYSLKKKWFEDSVFKNQSKNDTKTQKRFVNDTVRSDFHRKFLSKSIQ
jgi:protein CWC15